MKKLTCALAVVMCVLCLLTACNFTANVADSFGGAAESTPKVEKMMQALADGDLDSDLSLMYPSVAEGAGDAVAQMRDYLAGREVAELNQISGNIHTSTGTSGKSSQESAVFQAVLEDGTEIYLSTAYYTDNSGEGFASFQIVLGVV